MKEINDGGPAFPQTDFTMNIQADTQGMTLRQHYFSQALIGFLSNPTWCKGIYETAKKGDVDQIRAIVNCGFAIADEAIAFERGEEE